MSDIEKARQARADRAVILEALGKGSLSLRRCLSTPPLALRRATLWTVLIRTRGIGPIGARKVCASARVTFPETPLGNLTADDLDKIIKALPERVK